jgi:hypothetical protein
MRRKRGGIGLCLILAVIIGLAAVAFGGRDGVPVYRLKKLAPKGFDVFRGVLDWVPVSRTAGVAFAANYDSKADENSLASFRISNTGAAAAGQVVASGKGRPWAAACVWFEGGEAGFEAGSPFGYVFVLFEVYVSKPESETASIWMAKFDAQGSILGDWTELLKVKTPAGRYIGDEELFAFSRGTSVAVVPSLNYDSRQGQRKSLVYFLEIDSWHAALIGTPVTLSLPQNGDYIWAIGSEPGWNGSSWLVPVAVTLSKSPGREKDIFAKKALAYTIAADAAHGAVAHQIAADLTAGWGSYGDMGLAAYPGSAADQVLFLKKEKEIPEAKRKQEMFQYSFSLNRINATGALVQTKKISVPALAHKLAYDPDAELAYPDDYWTRPVAKGTMLYLSRAHSYSDWKQNGSGRRDGGTQRFEQQYGFYAINVLTGAVTLKAQTTTLVSQAYVMPPCLRSFPSGPPVVVNTVWFYSGYYPRWSYFSKFAY